MNLLKKEGVPSFFEQEQKNKKEKEKGEEEGYLIWVEEVLIKLKEVDVTVYWVLTVAQVGMLFGQHVSN